MPTLRQKLRTLNFSGLLLLSVPVMSSDNGMCTPEAGVAKALVTVDLIKSAEGNIRLQVYGGLKEEFLEKGKKILRIDHPTVLDGHQVCVSFPAAGKYALVAMHDRNANGKADFFTEGFGFSRNPELSLSKPDFDEVVVDIPVGVTDLTINLKYLWNSDKEKTERRRRLRRR